MQSCIADKVLRLPYVFSQLIARVLIKYSTLKGRRLFIFVLFYHDMKCPTLTNTDPTSGNEVARNLIMPVLTDYINSTLSVRTIRSMRRVIIERRSLSLVTYLPVSNDYGNICLDNRPHNQSHPDWQHSANMTIFALTCNLPLFSHGRI